MKNTNLCPDVKENEHTVTIHLLATWYNAEHSDERLG